LLKEKVSWQCFAVAKGVERSKRNSGGNENVIVNKFCKASLAKVLRLNLRLVDYAISAAFAIWRSFASPR